ncbi:MAG: asparaginase [Alphaproteobacteria bacterium]|nr:asparaginase [Alphaproteobacteria bacterium]MCB9698318.1 asparaginase [Alphaproteobacteria bacterium]
MDQVAGGEAGGRRVRLLHTGGTLGMTGSPLEPGAYQAQLLDHVPELGRLARVEPRIVCNLDSSDMAPTHWAELATIVAEERECYDGFVVVHGTDTMAYTASALTFALRGLDRPVVLTGAQRPLSALRTDARRNLADAVELATCAIPEVAICFDGLLFRGCRAVKADTRHYRAFASPGVEPIAVLGTDVHLSDGVRPVSGPFHCDPRFDPRVDVIWIHPGLRPESLSHRLADPNLRGLVIAAFGVGTVPRNGVAAAIASAVERGVVAVACTQWGGSVRLGLYRNSEALRDAGAIDGGEMRVEAAVPKLMHALATLDSPAEIRAYLERDVAGERE